MKPLAAVMALGLAIAAENAIPKRPEELKFPPRVFTPPKSSAFQHKLKNGAVAFLVEDHELPLINIEVVVRTGEYLDPDGKRGLAQLAGSQMRAGGTKTKPPGEFDEEAAFLAANLASGMSDTSASATLNCLAKDLDSGLGLFLDMLRNPGFAEERLKLAKVQILQGMERRNDSTPGIELREFRRLLRGDQHFSSASPTKASIESITRQDLIDFHQRYYFPANFVLAVSGDFKTPEMLTKLEKALADWPNQTAAVPPVPKPSFTPRPGVYMVSKREVNQTRVRIGHLGVTINNPDHLALSLMNGVLGGNSFSSRIVERVRSDEGLAYSAGSAFPAGTYYEGVFQVGFQSKNPSVAQAISIVLEEIERMRKTKVSADELKIAKASAIEALPLRFATAAAKAGVFATDYYTKLPADYWTKYSARLEAVTPEEIERVAKKYLHPDQLVILAVGNDEVFLKGNPDRPQYSMEKIAGAGGFTRIPLPDPLTMVYPK